MYKNFAQIIWYIIAFVPPNPEYVFLTLVQTLSRAKMNMNWNKKHKTILRILYHIRLNT